MARITYVKRAQPRYKTVPVLDEDGNQKRTPVMSKRKDAEGNPIQKTDKKGNLVFRRISMSDTTQPLPPHKCEKCGKGIEPGTPYKWVQPKTGPYGGRKRFRCMDCPNWTRGELTSSKMGSVWDAADSFSVEGCESASEMNEALQELADTVREVAEEYGESAENIREGFGHDTGSSEDLDERKTQLEDWAEELEDDVDEVIPDPCDQHDENVAHPDSDSEEDCEGCQALWDEALDDMRSTAMDKAANCPL